jgi:hypothetical protein
MAQETIGSAGRDRPPPDSADRSEHDRIVLITGASAGIGKATADRLASADWTVIGASRRGTGGDNWAGISMDVDDDDSVEQGVAGVVARHGRLDAVVAGAGWGLAGPLEWTAIGDAKAQFETNFWGVVRAVQAVLPVMRAQGSGRIVIVSSLGAVVGIPFQGMYSATKFALGDDGATGRHHDGIHGPEARSHEPRGVRPLRHRVAQGDQPYGTKRGRRVAARESREHDRARTYCEASAEAGQLRQTATTSGRAGQAPPPRQGVRDRNEERPRGVALRFCRHQGDTRLRPAEQSRLAA